MLVSILCLSILNIAPSPESAREEMRESLRAATVVYAMAGAVDVFTTASFVLRGGHEKNPLLAPLQDRPVLMLTVGVATSTAGVWAWNRFVGRKHPTIAKVGLYAAAGAHAFFAARNYHKHLERVRIRDSWKAPRGTIFVGQSVSWQ